MYEEWAEQVNKRLGEAIENHVSLAWMLACSQIVDGNDNAYVVRCQEKLKKSTLELMAAWEVFPVKV